MRYVHLIILISAWTGGVQLSRLSCTGKPNTKAEWGKGEEDWR